MPLGTAVGRSIRGGGDGDRGGGDGDEPIQDVMMSLVFGGFHRPYGGD